MPKSKKDDEKKKKKRTLSSSEHKPRHSTASRKEEKDKDPFRWVILFVFLLILFISYAFWAVGQK
ncbi:hypothetical protein C5B42_02015 [Candidatus Cerribacteria bacterium 'Amazon FNV 2010 28 9']|uniref:Uncharacterized protein n=1 Tax=Candidatus Cerribacteria bacterium 'Amazon FNV 2010 28 9' TaxID=2081795 RepID=A0A317JPV0_9BACT|nr:MAG: hypothetical protein C5B42_02015 [Candidatus Cerribacteria bacterium 'Amazon FNV 2010 28 9']